MSAPVASTRVTPTGIRLENGHPTKITLSGDTDIEFWETQVKPPGIDGGDVIETTTMHNVTWRSKAARNLKTLTDITVTAGYDPIVYSKILLQINVEQTITIRFPDGSTLAFYGFLKSFEPSELSEGTFPTASITIVATNSDPVSGSEEAPVLVNVAGT